MFCWLLLRWVSAGTSPAPWLPCSVSIRWRPVVSGDPAHQHTGNFLFHLRDETIHPLMWRWRDCVASLQSERLVSGPAEGGGGERPGAGQTDPGREERAEDGAVSRTRDEGESGATAHLRTTEQRYDFKSRTMLSERWCGEKSVGLKLQSCFLFSLHPEAPEEGEEGQEEAAGGAGVRVQEEGAGGGRSQTLVLVLPLSWAAARRQQQHQERYVGRDVCWVVLRVLLTSCLSSLGRVCLLKIFLITLSFDLFESLVFLLSCLALFLICTSCSPAFNLCFSIFSFRLGAFGFLVAVFDLNVFLIASFLRLSPTWFCSFVLTLANTCCIWALANRPLLFLCQPSIKSV